MRNEAPFLLEWVAFHSLLGFDRIMVATNDCTDGTDFMLERLQDLGVIQHVRNPMHEGLGPQQSAIKEIIARGLFADLDWVLHIDADEFLNIHLEGHSIAELTTFAGEADAVALMWRPFGNSGHTKWNGESILKTFTATQSRPRPQNASHKTLFRPDRFSSAIDHMPKLPVSEDIVLLNTAGQRCSPHALFHPRQSRYRFLPEQLTWENAQINHYAIRSDDIFLMKNVRGDGMGRTTTKYYLNSKFYRRQNKNGGQDKSILRHEAKLDTIMDDFLADPILGFLHKHAVETFFRQRDRVLTPDQISDWTITQAA